jgi:hypothetical protein
MAEIAAEELGVKPNTSTSGSNGGNSLSPIGYLPWAQRGKIEPSSHSFDAGVENAPCEPRASATSEPRKRNRERVGAGQEDQRDRELVAAPQC